jgi:hypothetical protein
MPRRSIPCIAAFATIVPLLVAAEVRADDSDEPGHSASLAVPDASLRAVTGGVVELRLRDGGVRSGRLLAFEAATVTIASANGEVVSLARADVIGLRLISAATSPAAAPAPSPVAESPVEPARPRHVGLNLGIPPGIDLDLDYGLFHGFASASLVFPAASAGNWWGVAIGLGLGIPVSTQRPNLKLDLFAHFNVMDEGTTCYMCSGTQVTYAFGVGIGLHYTWNNGLTLGFTAPILGYSITTNTIGYNGYSTSSNSQGVAYYYLSSAIALPLAFIGYRFGAW